jgi:3D (Asp-Asp-Asp) domain-containing protein
MIYHIVVTSVATIFMKHLNTLILSALLCSNCYSEEYLARVTYYWDGHQTSTGAKLTVNKTIAVDPKIIPYKSKVFIPKMGKTFVAQDTGSAVKSRTASRRLGKSNIVVDIYCKTKKEAESYIRKYPMFMEIKVIK